MIDYYKGYYGASLLFRVHGSPLYKAMIPGLLSVMVYLLLYYYWCRTCDFQSKNDLSEGQAEVALEVVESLDHPYAVGVLVTSISFLIVFRANQGYARYWEACGAVHQMMSKWLDATTHAGMYYLQNSHLNDIKPPSYYDHDDLNFLGLTRDRERGRPSLTATDTGSHEEYFSVRTRESSGGEDGRGAKERSINKVWSHRKNSFKMHTNWKNRESAFAECTPSWSRDEEDRGGSGGRSHGHPAPPQSVQPATTTTVTSTPTTATPRSPSRRHDHPIPYATSPPPEGEDPDVAPPLLNSHLTGYGYHPPLLGPPRLDGGFGMATEYKQAPTHGFTPPLFLQDLCHLSSLCVAVAFCTLRNDIEGAESPLDLYVPGQKWPAVDPDKLPKSSRKEFGSSWLCIRNFEYFAGTSKSKMARTRYNSTRPMQVLGGVSDAEIRMLQRARGASAKTQLAWNWLSEYLIREHLAGTLGKVGPPIVSRCFQFLSDGMIFYNHARKVMFIPFPFPSAQISVFFIFTLVWAVPFMMMQYVNNTALGAALVFFTVTCLSGLHEVGRELENPFRNIPNEIPLCTLLAQYNESLVTMYLGYHPDAYWNKALDADGDYVGVNGEGASAGGGMRANNKKKEGESEPEANVAVASEAVEGAPAKDTGVAGGDGDLLKLEEKVARQAEEIRELRILLRGGVEREREARTGAADADGGVAGKQGAASTPGGRSIGTADIFSMGSKESAAGDDAVRLSAGGRRLLKKNDGSTTEDDFDSANSSVNGVDDDGEDSSSAVFAALNGRSRSDDTFFKDEMATDTDPAAPMSGVDHVSSTAPKVGDSRLVYDL